jgi:hypothetical protein
MDTLYRNLKKAARYKKEMPEGKPDISKPPAGPLQLEEV